MSKTKKPVEPKRYEITFAPAAKKYRKSLAAPPVILNPLSPDTRVRSAISRARAALKIALPWTAVTVRAFGGGLRKTGRVEYQAHVNGAGKIVVEER